MSHDYRFKLIGKSDEDNFNAKVFRANAEIGTAVQRGYGAGGFANLAPEEREAFKATALAKYPNDAYMAEELFVGELAFLAEMGRKRKIVFIFDGGESDLIAHMHEVREVGGLTHEQVIEYLKTEYPGRSVAIFNKKTFAFEPIS